MDIWTKRTYKVISSPILIQAKIEYYFLGYNGISSQSIQNSTYNQK